MNYVSTRGQASGVKSAEAIRLGIAPDGGLFTPDNIPKLSKETIQNLKGQSYQDLATEILKLFLTDYSPGDLSQMTHAAYRFPDKFTDPKIVPVTPMGKGQYLLDLWHGPTCAFKDVALQLLPHLLSKANQITGNPGEIVILVATSGDTGKAALEGFCDVPGTRIIVFFPERGVSQIQRLQMITQEGANTCVISVRGNFDDAQNGVKEIFADNELISCLKRNNQTFSSANSINWGRLVPQIVYYFHGYLELCRANVIELGEKINVTVPTGNFGNILAAYFAKQMGLPVAKLICASNSNNVLTEFIKTGIYNRNRDFYTTISPSMDILISSNLERLLYYLTDSHPEQVKTMMSKLKSSGSYQVSNLVRERIMADFNGGYAAESETKNTIRQVFKETGLIIDTHTAVGVSVYQKYLQETGDTAPVLYASTASPFKFNSSVLEAILGNDSIHGLNEFELLQKLETISGVSIPKNLQGLERKPVKHNLSCDKEEMGQVVRKVLGVS